MRKELNFDERIALLAKRNGLTVTWQQLKYGLKRAAFDCDSYEEMYAVENLLQRMGGAVLEHWYCGEGIFEGRVYAMDAADYAELQKQQREDPARLENWWQRYHDADAETRRLMACGAIE